MDEQPKSIHDILRTAMQAQDAGVPVDWQRLCVDTINTATNEVTQLEHKIEALQDQLDDQKLRSDG